MKGSSVSADTRNPSDTKCSMTLCRKTATDLLYMGRECGGVYLVICDRANHDAEIEAIRQRLAAAPKDVTR